MLKENTESILKQVLNMESQLINNGRIIEKFKSKSDEAFDQLLNGTKDKTEKTKRADRIINETCTVNDKEDTEKRNVSSKNPKTRAKKPDSTTNIKIEKVEQVKLNIKEEIDDHDYQELEEEACLDAEEGETETEYVEVQNTLKIETDESQANIFDIEEMDDLVKPVKKEPVYTNNNTSANDNDSVKPKEYSLKRLHMDLVEYLDKNRKKPKLTPTKKQYSHKEEVYCVCKSRYRSDRPMIGCDGPCKDWYHFNCVGIPKDFRSIAEW